MALDSRMFSCRNLIAYRIRFRVEPTGTPPWPV
jgi:hypothetical protein